MARRAKFTLGAARPSEREEFFSQLVSGPPEACWGWTGRRTLKGYPVFMGTLVRRLLPEAFPAIVSPEVAAARRLTTTCRNTGCTNPGHLVAPAPRMRKPREMETFTCPVCHRERHRPKGSTRRHCTPRCRVADATEIREAKLQNLLERLDDVRHGVEALTIRKAPRGPRA